ncbi:hypothetical protein GCM10022267_75660 [Lentzea roselyniae]|uniref:Excreted virulence factor EspC, type VII ESX diderm n=1 Tax=Lentzea roselyniae TaxID=531940 RepID=A0ABP7C4V5_9PSEU
MADNFKFSDDDLVKIISGTQGAIERMGATNVQVSAVAMQLPFVNNSAAGQKLGAGLQDWNANFGKVVNGLDELNKKAQALLAANRATAEAAALAAGQAEAQAPTNF